MAAGWVLHLNTSIGTVSEGSLAPAFHSTLSESGAKPQPLNWAYWEGNAFEGGLHPDATRDGLGGSAGARSTAMGSLAGPFGEKPT